MNRLGTDALMTLLWLLAAAGYGFKARRWRSARKDRGAERAAREPVAGARLRTRRTRFTALTLVIGLTAGLVSFPALLGGGLAYAADPSGDDSGHCLFPPTPAVPGSTWQDVIDSDARTPQQDPPRAGRQSYGGTYGTYGWAGMSYYTFDNGCQKLTNIAPGAFEELDNSPGNLMLFAAKMEAATAIWLDRQVRPHPAVADHRGTRGGPGRPIAPAESIYSRMDDLVATGSRALSKAFYYPWMPAALIILGGFLLVSALKADHAAALRRGVLAAICLGIGSMAANAPLNTVHAVDTQVLQVTGNLGDTALTSAGYDPVYGPRDLMYSVVQRQWLAGYFSDPDSPQAQLYADRLRADVAFSYADKAQLDAAQARMRTVIDTARRAAAQLNLPALLAAEFGPDYLRAITAPSIANRFLDEHTSEIDTAFGEGTTADIQHAPPGVRVSFFQHPELWTGRIEQTSYEKEVQPLYAAKKQDFIALAKAIKQDGSDPNSIQAGPATDGGDASTVSYQLFQGHIMGNRIGAGGKALVESTSVTWFSIVSNALTFVSLALIRILVFFAPLWIPAAVIAASMLVKVGKLAGTALIWAVAGSAFAAADMLLVLWLFHDRQSLGEGWRLLLLVFLSILGMSILRPVKRITTMLTGNSQTLSRRAFGVAGAMLTAGALTRLGRRRRGRTSGEGDRGDTNSEPSTPRRTRPAPPNVALGDIRYRAAQTGPAQVHHHYHFAGGGVLDNRPGKQHWRPGADVAVQDSAGHVMAWHQLYDPHRPQHRGAWILSTPAPDSGDVLANTRPLDVVAARTGRGWP